MHDELRAWLAEASDSSAAPALHVLVGGVAALQPQPSADFGAYGVRFHAGSEALCEISVFGELFIVRVGPQHTVEYRVRDVATALEALDHVVRHHLRLHASAAV
jgi:hypothetical protein